MKNGLNELYFIVNVGLIGCNPVKLSISLGCGLMKYDLLLGLNLIMGLPA